MGTTKVWNGGIVVQFLAGMPIRRVAGNFYHRPICIYSVLEARATLISHSNRLSSTRLLNKTTNFQISLRYIYISIPLRLRLKLILLFFFRVKLQNPRDICSHVYSHVGTYKWKENIRFQSKIPRFWKMDTLGFYECTWFLAPSREPGSALEKRDNPLRSRANVASAEKHLLLPLIGTTKEDRNFHGYLHFIHRYSSQSPVSLLHSQNIRNEYLKFPP